MDNMQFNPVKGAMLLSHLLCDLLDHHHRIEVVLVTPAGDGKVWIYDGGEEAPAQCGVDSRGCYCHLICLAFIQSESSIRSVYKRS